MTLAQVGRLRPDDEVAIESLSGLGTGKPPVPTRTIARVFQPWDGMRIMVRLGNGELMALAEGQISVLSRAGTAINGVPREVVAFAAGVHATGTRNFQVIAATIDALGMGKYEPVALEVGVRDWTRDLTRDFDTVVAALDGAVRSTRGMPS